MEGSGRGLIEVISRHLRIRTEKTSKTLIQEIRCSGGDSNQTPATYVSIALPLPQPAQGVTLITLLV
jgi:hypothetical protein